MGPLVVVVRGPSPDFGARMGHVPDHGFVQKLIAHSAVEVFHEAVLHRLARRDVMPLNSALGGEG